MAAIQPTLPPAVPGIPSVEHEEFIKLAASETSGSNHRGENDSLDKDAEAGVRAVQAATSVWSKTHLWSAYGIIWLMYRVICLQEPIVRAMNPYVTSAFRLHSLTAAVGIMSSIIGGLSQIPLAKILDTWGRPQGIAISMVV